VRVSVDADSRAARIEVLDEGPGISPSEREAVFDAFRRGRNAASSGAGGSGIGLTIVREIVAAHGGTVSVAESARGARFVVELPSVEARAGAERVVDPVESPIAT
jgi:signal transduction histidine kinase